MITTHILLGNREDAANYTALRKLGVTHILNAAQQVPNQHPGEFCYHKLNILGIHAVQPCSVILLCASVLFLLYNVLMVAIYIPPMCLAVCCCD